MPPRARFAAFGGEMFYYDTDKRFTAVCGNPLHGVCILTRYAKPRSRMKGRPVGFMMAWLGSGAVAEDRESHWAAVAEIEGSPEFRNEQRQWMLTQDGGPEFLSFERNAESGLGEEPAAP